MTHIKLLKFDPGSLPEDGITIEGAISPRDLDIPQTDRIDLPHPISFRLHAAPVHGGVLVQGNGETILRCRCDRCLQYFDLPLQINNICHFFKNTECDEIDLTNDVREDILLSFPQSVHCKTECRGLCPLCGQNLNVRDCGCRPSTDIGSTWDVLDQLELPHMDTQESEQ